MNSVIQLTLKDVGMFFLWGLVCAVLIYVLMILYKAHKMVKKVDGILDDHREKVDQIMEEVPGITKSVNEISEEVAHGMQAFRGTVDNIAETSEDVTGTIKENNTVVESLTSVFHTASMVKSAYDRFFNPPEDEDVPECPEKCKPECE